MRHGTAHRPNTVRPFRIDSPEGYTLIDIHALTSMIETPSPKRLVLGITGGIAAYKSAELTRLLRQENWEVQVVMTEAATRFITPMTLQALSGKPVMLDLWESHAGNGMDHIEATRARAIILIAPASADFIAKLASGIADDLLSTLCLARDCPMLVAPAMNRQMWESPATRRNVARLIDDGIHVAGPASGEQACGEVGFGRMIEPIDLVQEVHRATSAQHLSGRRVLVTAGPTFEPIDPVRGITNRSSGKMGYAIAQAAYEAGAEVTIVSGPATAAPPYGPTLISVTTAQEMLESVQFNLDQVDIFVAVAAVADYRAETSSARKIKRSSSTLSLALAANQDILATVAAMPGAPFCVGFAAESEDLDRHAQEKRITKGVPLLVGNIAQAAIGADESTLVMYDASGRHPLPRSPKLENARRIVEHIALMLRGHTKVLDNRGKIAT